MQNRLGRNILGPRTEEETINTEESIQFLPSPSLLINFNSVGKRVEGKYGLGRLSDAQK